MKWIEEHELAWRARKKMCKCNQALRQHTKRDWAASARAFAEHFGHARGVLAIQHQAYLWSQAHPQGSDYNKWSAAEESWLAERVIHQIPADAQLRECLLHGVASAFEDKFRYKRTAAAIRHKVEGLRRRACQEAWAACLQAPLETAGE